MAEYLTHQPYPITLSLSFDDVLMSPRYSTVKSRKDVDLSINIGTSTKPLQLKTPFISSPMDTVTMANMATAIALCGGLGIIHRFLSIEDQVAEVRKVKRYLQYIITKPYIIYPNQTIADIHQIKKESGVSTFCVIDSNNQLVGLLTNRDIEYVNLKKMDPTNYQVSNLMVPFTKLISINMIRQKFEAIIQGDSQDDFKALITLAKDMMIEHKIEKIPIVETATNSLLGLITWKNIKHYENNESTAALDSKGRLICGAAIGVVGDYLQRLQALLEAEVDLICVDVANAMNEHVLQTLKNLTTSYPNVVFMGGNVCSGDALLKFAETGVKILRLGVGNGGACETRKECGIGKSQFTVIHEAFEVKNKHNLDIILVSDGGLCGKTGSAAKALAAGVDCIILGRTLASTYESPGVIIQKDGQNYKYYRGMASTPANISKQEKCANINSGKTGEIIKHHSEGTDGYTPLRGSVKDVLEQLNNGIRSSLSYLGCHSIPELHELRRNREIEFNLITSVGQLETGTRVLKF
jgi:IMP dehydrogenase